MTSNIWTESECGADFLAQKLGAGGSCLHCLMVNPPLITYAVHIDSVSVSSGVLIRLYESCRQRLGDEVEPDELSDAREHLAVVLGALVDSQHHRRYVAEYRGAHQRCSISQPLSLTSIYHLSFVSLKSGSYHLSLRVQQHLSSSSFYLFRTAQKHVQWTIQCRTGHQGMKHLQTT